MNWDGTGMNWGLLAAVYMFLLLFGIGFNMLTAWADHKGYQKGYTALFVAGGVAVTVGLTAVISLVFALVVAGAFMASGTPMIIGSMWRHMREREQQLKQLHQEGPRGDAP